MSAINNGNYETTVLMLKRMAPPEVQSRGNDIPRLTREKDALEVRSATQKGRTAIAGGATVLTFASAIASSYEGPSEAAQVLFAASLGCVCVAMAFFASAKGYDIKISERIAAIRQIRSQMEKDGQDLKFLAEKAIEILKVNPDIDDASFAEQIRQACSIPSFNMRLELNPALIADLRNAAEIEYQKDLQEEIAQAIKERESTKKYARSRVAELNRDLNVLDAKVTELSVRTETLGQSIQRRRQILSARLNTPVTHDNLDQILERMKQALDHPPLLDPSQLPRMRVLPEEVSTRRDSDDDKKFEVELDRLD
jgi:hypothetical protein